MSFADSAATHCTQKKESSGSLVTHVADPAPLGRALDARRQTVHVKTAVTLIAEQQLVVVVRRAWGIGCVITYKRTRWNRKNHRTINTRTDTRNQEKPLNLHRYFYFKQKKEQQKSITQGTEERVNSSGSQHEVENVRHVLCVKSARTQRSKTDEKGT